MIGFSRSALILGAAVFVFAGCRTESNDASSPEARASGEADTTEVASTFEISSPERVQGASQRTREVNLVSQTDDETACYLVVENAGTMEMLMAEKDLCGVTYEFEGERVKITQEDATVRAISCAGDPDCPDNETVPLVVSVERR